eukprot:TRINITY_DN37728_c0_g1_i1.p1 TRINITY_DN37728_c0_g1~~TRINITY_DN37728_c0_g1_i1.p1  ORF type:complete len:420 (+),score=94.87 TRINITY_DN37728_c0_g1_i1:82-1341(+)
MAGSPPAAPRALAFFLVSATLAAASVLQVQEKRSKLLAGKRDQIPHLLLRTSESKRAEVSQLKQDFPHYHDSAELSAEVRRLAKECKSAELRLETVSEDDVHIDVAHVRLRGRKHAAPNRVCVVSGEHSREVIGPESTIRFLQLLCGEGGHWAHTVVSDVLQDATFAVVVNANPRSRQKVDAGEYCVRENPNGVDLNRNWDEKWTSPMTLETNRGAKPFSEPETRLLRGIIEKFKPTTFLSVHSGTAGLYMPWAWSTDSLANRNQPAMMSLLESIDRNHCKCPFGAAGKEVGYPCPGTSVDYVYDKLGAQFSFAFEIWGDMDMESMHERWRAKANSGGYSLLMTGANLGHPHFREVFDAYPSEFVQTGASVHSQYPSDPSSCFRTFNPLEADQLKKCANNWAAAYLEMVVNTSAIIKSQ